MIILRTDILKLWLRVTGRNQAWLAAKMGFSKGYISRIMNNDCKMSREFVDRILLITHMPFENLFKNDGKDDLREWFGEVFCVNGRPMHKQTYYDLIRREQNCLDIGAMKD